MDAKLQHYVPQLLLNYFANDRGLLLTHDLLEGRRFPQPVKTAAAETHFYRVENPGEEPHNEMERFFGRYERPAADAIARLRRGGVPTKLQRSR